MPPPCEDPAPRHALAGGLDNGTTGSLAGLRQEALPSCFRNMDEARPLISNLLELAVNWLMKLTFQVYRQRSTEKVRPRVSCSSPKPNVSELTFWSEDLSDNYDSGQVLIAPRRLALVVVDSTNSVERNPMYTVVGPVLTRTKAMSQPRQFAATIAVRVGEAVGGRRLARTPPRRVTSWLATSIIAPPAPAL